jgi:hypothetical protein
MLACYVDNAREACSIFRVPPALYTRYQHKISRARPLFTKSAAVRQLRELLTSVQGEARGIISSRASKRSKPIRAREKLFPRGMGYITSPPRWNLNIWSLSRLCIFCVNTIFNHR